MLDREPYGLSPISPQGQSDAAESALRNAIVRCELEPGVRFSEVELCSKFAFGRGAIRAALSRLQGQSFVSSAARSGWLIAPISASEIREVSAGRRQLEPLLCNVVLTSGDRSSLHRLAEMQMALMQRYELEPNSLATIRRCERDILRSLATRMAMPTIGGWLETLWERSERLVNFFESTVAEKLKPAPRWLFVEALLTDRRADAASSLRDANQAIETFLLDRFLQSEAIVGVATPARLKSTTQQIHPERSVTFNLRTVR